MAAPATPAAIREPVPPPNLRTDRATRQRADQRAGILARAGSGIRIARAAGEAR